MDQSQLSQIETKSKTSKKSVVQKTIKSLVSDSTFEIFTHLKYNLKNRSKICDFHESDFTGYCFSCRNSVCDVCITSLHSNHNFIMKSDYPQQTSFFLSLFEELEKDIVGTENLIQPSKLLKEIKTSVEFEMDDIIEKFKDLKAKRLKELEALFISSNYDCNKLRLTIKNTKDKLVKFFNRNKEFVDLNTVTDEDNFIFLQNYDLINELLQAINNYGSIITQVNTTYTSFPNINDPKFNEICKMIDSLLLDQKKKEIKKANEEIWDNINSFNAVVLNESNSNRKNGNTHQKRRSSVLEKFPPLNSLSTNQNNNEENTKKRRKSTNSEKEKVTNNSHSQKLINSFEKLNEDLFSKFRDKLEHYDNFNENFKSLVFDSIKKNQSLSEISKLVKGFEEKVARKIVLSTGSRKINLNKSTLKSKKYLNEGSSPYSSNNSLIKKSVKQLAQNVDDKRSTNNSPNGKNKKHHFSPEKAKTAMESNQHDKKHSSKKNKLKIACVEENNEEKSSGHDSDEDKINIDVNMKLNNKVENDRIKVYSKVDKVFRPKPKNKIIKVINPKNKEMKEGSNTKENNTISTNNNINTLNTINTTITNNTINTNKQASNRYKVNTELAELVQENAKLMKTISSKDKVTLTIPTIRKYYSFNFLDYLRNLEDSALGMKQTDKSIVDILDKNILDTDPYSNIVVKVIEGTDEIHLYNKNSNKLEKRKVDIDVKKYNTKVFYKGCRWYHIQGRIYICGGKDFNGDKVLFMVYNIKDKKLIRLMDMKYPRSFHSLVYHENIRALIALGGENNNSCEMYDFYLNIWNDFPEMNYSRGNVNFLVNEDGTYAYAMFGLINDIVNKQLTDVIEVIDMIDMNKGWYKLDYSNKTGVDLKTKELKVKILPHNKILLYGGNESRNPNVLYMILDLKTLEMHKVDQKQGELLKLENENFNNFDTIMNEAQTQRYALSTLGTNPALTARSGFNDIKKKITESKYVPFSTKNKNKLKEKEKMFISIQN